MSSSVASRSVALLLILTVAAQAAVEQSQRPAADAEAAEKLFQSRDYAAAAEAFAAVVKAGWTKR
jgi:hypothetical protein